MTNKIITVLGLPGVGKSLYCAVKSKQENVQFRPEPTDDIIKLRHHLSDAEINDLILDRFNAIDPVLNLKYRDSDYWTSFYTFGGSSNLSGYISPVSDELHFIYCGPEKQKAQIIKRNRLFTQQELQFCDAYWHKIIIRAFRLHPAPVKKIFTALPNLIWQEQPLLCDYFLNENT